jgi:hypothetical protein
VKEVNETYGIFPRRYREGIFSAISAGFFFIIIGIIFLTTPNLFQRIAGFFTNFGLERIPYTTIYFPAPVNPLQHQEVYQAVEQFSFALGLFQIVILALRFFAGSPWNKKAETTSNLVFWIGISYLIRALLIESNIQISMNWNGMTTWFVYWSALIMLCGVSLIVRAIVFGAASVMRLT